MGFFSKKQEVNLEEFCRDFYERNYLNPIIKGIDAGTVICEAFKHSIEEKDSTFENVDYKKFAREIAFLQFELFALAWLYQFGDKSAIAQSVFTKNYLNEKNRNDIWENSEDYNQAIARSSTAGKISKNALDRAYLARVYKTRADLFDRLTEEGFDPKCVARALNRLFSDKAWEKGVTVHFLMFKLCDRLGLKQDELNKLAQQQIIFVIRMIYDGAKQSLENIKIKI